MTEQNRWNCGCEGSHKVNNSKKKYTLYMSTDGKLMDKPKQVTEQTLRAQAAELRKFFIKLDAWEKGLRQRELLLKKQKSEHTERKSEKDQMSFDFDVSKKGILKMQKMLEPGHFKEGDMYDGLKEEIFKRAKEKYYSRSKPPVGDEIDFLEKLFDLEDPRKDTKTPT